MNAEERIKMVKAMEFIARSVNDEEVFMPWLVIGVADEDIEYGDLAGGDDGTLEAYTDDDADFADLMDTFLNVMNGARRSGGLFCDGVVSKGEDE